MYKSKTNIFYLLLIFCLTILYPVTVSADTTDKGNISGHWAEKSLEKWSERKIIIGDENGLRPDDFITRAEFSTILNRIVKYQNTNTLNFSDLSRDSWYYDDIAKLHTAGIIEGYGDSSIKPERDITREEAVVLLVKAFDIEKADSDLNFNDSNKISPWAVQAIQSMYSKKHILGDTSGNVRPHDKITRAEAMVMLDRICSVLISKEGEYTEDVNGNLVVSSSGVKLKNMKISGDLYIMEGVGDGDLILDNVEVEGKTFARGGGSNSLYLNNCTIKELVAVKDTLHIVLDNGTKVSFFKSNFKDGIIDLKNCHIEKITIIGESLKLRMNSDSFIKTLNSDSNDTVIEGEKGSKIEQANLNGKTKILGKVSVDNANIKIDGCVIETPPKNVNIKSGVTAVINSGEKTGDSSSSSSGGSSPAESFKSHDIPNLNNIPYKTAFEQLNLAKKATLTSSNGNNVEVNLTWTKSEYRSNLSGEAQTLYAKTSAISGTLPSWVPKKISITVTVLEAPVPAAFDMYSSSSEYTIVKGDKATYSIQIKDKNGTLMHKDTLDDANVTMTNEDVPAGILVTASRESVTISVPKNFDQDEFELTLNLIHKGGKISKTFLIKIKNPSTSTVPAVTDIELYQTYIDKTSNKGAMLNIRFKSPDDISNIKEFKLIFENSDDPSIKYPVPITFVREKWLYDFNIIQYFTNPSIDRLPDGNYKIKVISVAKGDDNELLNNLAVSEYSIEYKNNNDSLNNIANQMVWENACITGITNDDLNMIIDYHYKDKITPDEETFIVYAVSNENDFTTDLTPVFSNVHAKGRLDISFKFNPGTSQNIIPPLQIFLNNYKFKIQDKAVTIEVSSKDDSANEQIDPSAIQGRNIYDHFTYGPSNTHGNETIKNPLGTNFNGLHLPDKVKLYSLFTDNLTAYVTWEDTGYSSNSTELQEIRGKISYQPPTNPNPEYEIPAWIPEYISIKVKLE